MALIAGASLVGVLVVFGLWHRLPATAAYVLLTSCGACLGLGGLLVQEDVGTASWWVAPVTLGLLAPLHARLVFGKPGRGMVAQEPVGT